MTFEFSTQIFEKKKVPILNFMKIRSVGAELFHADVLKDKTDTDGQT